MRCNKCRREAVLFQEYSGQHLCRQHFETDLERKAKHEIRTHHWLETGDHIAVALSGDANSGALLYFLKKITSSRHDIRISAISIDEGIRGYRDRGCANGIARASGTDCMGVSFPERFGMSIDEIAQRKGVALSCMYCRVIRNFLLDRIATEQGVTKLAMGDDLDDSAASVLKNILRGDADMLARSEQTGRGKIPRIRPFISIPKKEVALYAALHIKGYDQSRCPYYNGPFEEEDVKEMLEDFTIRHPATGYALMSLKKNLTDTFCTHSDTVPSCERCGEPSDGICTSCRIIDEVNAGGA
jgi:uncharacterized protein (TIGR00269 family)